MRLFQLLICLCLLLPVRDAGAQEPRLHAAPEPPSPSEYWEDLRPPEAAEPEPEIRVVPSRSPVWQSRYTLGPGDTLNFSIYDRADLSRENVQIGPDGTVSYLQAVAVRAQGLTLDELRLSIEQELSKYQRNVKVIVTPSQVGSKSFAIIGRVRKPGSFPLERPTTVLEGIALAEGIEVGTLRNSLFELADFERSFVARKGRKLAVDLAKLYYQGDFSQNAYLEPDDYIFVASNLENEIYVIGEVREPGRLRMPVKLTVAQAIGEAGGFTEAAFQARVLVIRGSIHEPVTQIVNLREVLQARAPDIRLQNRDIVFVSRSPFDLVERILDTAIVTFMQTVSAEVVNQAYLPLAIPAGQ